MSQIEYFSAFCYSMRVIISLDLCQDILHRWLDTMCNLYIKFCCNFQASQFCSSAKKLMNHELIDKLKDCRCCKWNSVWDRFITLQMCILSINSCHAQLKTHRITDCKDWMNIIFIVWLKKIFRTLATRISKSSSTICLPVRLHKSSGVKCKSQEHGPLKWRIICCWESNANCSHWVVTVIIVLLEYV
jgi:hypothetical protein